MGYNHGCVGGTYLQRHYNGVRLGNKADGGRALLDGLKGVLNLVQTACGRVSDRVVVIGVSKLERALAGCWSRQEPA